MVPSVTLIFLRSAIIRHIYIYIYDKMEVSTTICKYTNMKEKNSKYD